MVLELVEVRGEHAPQLARICHRAFDTFHARHQVTRDIPTEEVGQAIIGVVTGRPDYAGVAAMLDGKIVGSNFLLYADEVAGVGPITVDPDCQKSGVGKALMRWAIDEAARRGIRQIRLFQEAVNTTSLSLYARLGFTWRYAAALMQPAAASEADPMIRPMTGDDLPAVGELSRKHYGYSRLNDAAQLLKMNFPAFVRQRDRSITGYHIASLFGHGAGETIDDLLALTAHVAAHAPQPLAVFICPLPHPQLFNAALEAGYRSLKVLNCMSVGPYTAPTGHWLPSIQC